ncbi:hypothetical protein PYH37_001874 [Sinorhizobium numidicum]|uniref:Uncharacterized protein n=1 Tax=Sinorhizobium numidicum TaxID=680248 RepID=A0ABY8CP56_9HYPH|nr:hypothetical protein [Sinorhizobium numidicum]WEX74447.1 hypothetical protein PYH37_001874 [Sinorhizobium numidicum]WEX80436.1 hypothetical protein PYH38_001875 [Sinorhizobium numidicum]
MPERARQLIRDIRFIARDFRLTNADIQDVFGIDIRAIESLPDEQIVGAIELLTGCRETLEKVVRRREQTYFDRPDALATVRKVRRSYDR